MDTTAITRRAQQLDEWSRRAPGLGLLRAVLDKSGRDRGGDLAAVIAFFGFFSIFPLLLALGTIVGLVFADDPELQARAIDAVTDQFPDSPELQEAIATVPGSGWAVAIGLAGSLWGGMGVANATRTAFDEVWEIPRDDQAGLVRSRLVGLAAIVAVGGVLLASVALGSLAPGIAGRVGATLLALGAFAAVFAVLSPRGIGWRRLAPGVLVATGAWIVLQTLGTALIRRQLGQVSVGAGVFAGSLVLLAWMALQARIVVLAAELDQVLATRSHVTGGDGVGGGPKARRPEERSMSPDPDDRTTPDTRAAEERDALVRGQADRPPTAEEERIAEEHGDAADADVAGHYEEMAEIGAEVRGEGQIEP